MDEIIKLLKERGYRLTQSRINLIQLFVENKTKHYTHEELLEELKKSEEKVNNMSVYNNLKILLKEDIIKESIFLGKKIYELTEKNHAHFYCKKCKKDIEIIDDELYSSTKKIEDKYKVNVTNVKVEYVGICKECEENEHS